MEYHPEFDNRMKYFDFNATQPVLDWEESNIVKKVFDFELNEHFQSNEELLMYRLKVWADVCRVGGEDKEKVFAYKSKLKKSSTIRKIRSFSLGKIASRYVESSDNSMDEDECNNNMDTIVGRMRKEQDRKGRSISTLCHPTDYSASDIKVTESNEACGRYGSTSKKTFRLFSFRKKTKPVHKNKDKNENRDSNRSKSCAIKSNPLYIENESHNKRSKNNKLRPSIFDMRFIKGSVENLERQEYSYDVIKPVDTITSSSSKLNTNNDMHPGNNDGFKNINDAIKRKKKNSVVSVPLFYAPEGEAGIGY